MKKVWGFAALLLVAAAYRAPEPASAEVPGDHYLFLFTGSGLVDPYYVDGQGAAHPLDLSDSAFQKALAGGADAVVDVPVGDRTLELGGTVRGRVENGTISFLGKLGLVDDFSYSAGPVSATLKAGGSVTVSVEASAFRGAELAVAGDVNVEIKEQLLKLEGTLEGAIAPDFEIDFKGSLTVEADFVYERGAVKATLRAGGSAVVTVEDDAFTTLTLGNAHLTATIEVPGTDGLAVEGSVQGRYQGNAFDLDGSIHLEDPFAYERKGKKASLQAGVARLKLHDAKRAWVMVSQKKHATLKLRLDDDDDNDD